MNKSIAAWCALGIALFFSAAPLFARDVIVVIQDALFSLPLEGAVITRNNEKMVYTDEAGCAVFSLSEGESAALVIQYPAYRSARFIVPLDGGRFIIKLYPEDDDVRQNQELVFTAERSAQHTGRAGQSVALPEKERSNAAEIGLAEDVMSAIKLLPGVGYTGMFNAQPSLRGGEPHDVIAVLDGYYLREAYHWDGGYSVFAPSMVESAELFHGVFSARKGWTTSGLLEVESKKPFGGSAQFEAGVSTNAFDISFSLPFSSSSFKDGVIDNSAPSNKGGISLFGKITYWDAYFGLTKVLSEYVEELEPTLAIQKAPYINSAALSLRYSPFNVLELILNAYAGADGVEMYYEPFAAMAGIIGKEDVGLFYRWFNFIGFFNAGISYNPIPSTLIYFTAGSGYNILDVYHKSFSAQSTWQDRQAYPQYNTQIHISVDQQMGRSFLYAAGLELFLDEWQVNHYGKLKHIDFEIAPSTRKNFVLYFPDISNRTIMSALWTTLEWNSPSNKYRAEAGMRVADSIINSGGETIFSPFAFNPRLTFEYTVMRNTPHIESVIVSAGSGLFSSMNKDALLFDTKTGISSFKETQSWTSILAVRGKLIQETEINIELYYKYLFNQTYTNLKQIDENTAGYILMFNGYGNAFGVDVMLSKFYSNKLNGWISYSFNYTRYNNPNSIYAFEGAKFASAANHWYFPEFQRFHTINLVVNYNITAGLMLHTRIGFASGPPNALHKTGTYTLIDDGSTKYSDESEYSDKIRNAFSMPLDLKLSWYTFEKAGKAQCEFYIAGENLLVFFLPQVESVLFDSGRGKFYEGRERAVYDLPVPMASFGVKLSY